MNIFISWSGERSRKIAELLDGWIRCVIQAATPWISYKDIDRGSLWFTEISNILAETKVGIICITSENKNEPWILFEAGALAKGINSNRVCTFLTDIQPNDIVGPLAQFNHTFPQKDSMFGLVCTINAALGERALQRNVLDMVFETYWPQFERQFSDIISQSPAHTKNQKRDNTQIMDEMLSVVRSMDRRLRDVELRNEQRENRQQLSSPQPPPHSYFKVRRKIASLLSIGMNPEEIHKAIRKEFPSASEHYVDIILTDIGMTEEKSE